MAEPIEIIIRQGGQGGVGFGSATGGSVGNKPGEAALKRGSDFGKEGQKLIANAVIDDRIVSALQHQIKAGIMYAVNNYANMSGDYIGQQRIGENLGIMSDLMTIGISTAQGGWVGLAVSTAAVTFKNVTAAITHNIDVSKQNTQSSYMRERSGNSLNNGSSGTYE